MLLLGQGARAGRLRTPAVWMAGCCLLVLLLASVAEARHIHSSAQRDAQRCGVCVVSHSPTLLARVAPLAPEPVCRPLARPRETPTASALSLDSHFIRPPPAAL